MLLWRRWEGRGDSVPRKSAQLPFPWSSLGRRRKGEGTEPRGGRAGNGRRVGPLDLLHKLGTKTALAREQRRGAALRRRRGACPSCTRRRPAEECDRVRRSLGVSLPVLPRPVGGQLWTRRRVPRAKRDAPPRGHSGPETGEGGRNSGHVSTSRVAK